MKKFSQINEAVKDKLEVQDDAINYASIAQLNKYVEICDKFLSKEAKYICQFLIDNNASYISELPGASESTNALEGFYNAGVPKDAKYKELYKAIGTLKKSNHILEVPVFQSKEQFEGILDKSIAPDEIILDLDSEAGRNEIAKKYTPLVHKIAKSFYGKVNISYDDLVACGMEGLTNAMNNYGKKTNKNIADEETIKSYTFLSYAAFMIRFCILGYVKNTSHTVRIPISQQKRQKTENGYNVKNNSISGDTSVSSHSSKSEDGSKTIFDFIGADEYADKNLDREDVEKLFSEIYKAIEDKFDTKLVDIFYSYYGLNNYKKMKGKELAKKYNVAPNSITYYLAKVIKFLMSPEMHKKLLDIYELMKECLHDEETAEINDEPVYINQQRNSKNMYS